MQPIEVISVEHLSKSYHIYETPQSRIKQIFFGWHKCFYREFLALKNVSFNVEKGQSVGVIGRNGAGKSTLLQLLTGTLTPTSGKLSVKGKVAAVLELGSGFNPEFSGRENIYLYASLFELDEATIDERFQKIVDFSELHSFIDQPVKTYSSGMQARLAFSVIAHVDADILIIDEALSVGDAFFTQKCMRFLRKFQEHGTILFVSHDLGAVTAFCDQAIWLENGVVRDIGPAKDICESYYSHIHSPTPIEGDSCSELNGQTQGNIELLLPDTRQIIDRKTMQLEDSSLPTGAQAIETFGFNSSSASHGTNDAKIISVTFTDAHGRRLNICEGGTLVNVCITTRAIRDIEMPIVGFIIKDRLGQPLIGGNTYHAFKASPVYVDAGGQLEAEFAFSLPILAIGDYSIVAAIGNGTLQDHVHLHWMHDAVLFKVVATSIDGVLVGMPLDKITLTALAGEDIK